VRERERERERERKKEKIQIEREGVRENKSGVPRAESLKMFFE
jgi:hypothetical protein